MRYGRYSKEKVTFTFGDVITTHPCSPSSRIYSFFLQSANLQCRCPSSGPLKRQRNGWTGSVPSYRHGMFIIAAPAPAFRWSIFLINFPNIALLCRRMKPSSSHTESTSTCDKKEYYYIQCHRKTKYREITMINSEGDCSIQSTRPRRRLWTGTESGI